MRALLRYDPFGPPATGEGVHHIPDMDKLGPTGAASWAFAGMRGRRVCSGFPKHSAKGRRGTAVTITKNFNHFGLLSSIVTCNVQKKS